MFVVSPKSALAFYVIFLLNFAPVFCADAPVLISQAGATKEPFDVGGSLIYKVPLANNISSNMRYTVELAIGPDSTDYSISEKYKKETNINGHTTGYVEFNVNFRAPGLCRGEFGKWALDKNDTSVWDKAWYHAVATPLVGDPQVLESYDDPNLFKAFFDFKGAGITPTQGSNRDHYSYEVTVFGSYSDNLSLEVGPTAEGPWTNMGQRVYTTPGLLQTLKWSNVTLNFDFSMAYYRFKGTRESKVFEGPFWPVAMNIGNSSVIPGRGLSNVQFTYDVEVNASKKIDVVLNILDIGSKTFKPAGRYSYKNVSRWERLAWNGVQPSEVSGSEGRSSYFFTFHYPGSEAFFNKTKQYPGPDIVLVNFNNTTVSPDRGSAIGLFNYSVEINTGMPRCDVDLQTTTPGSSKWTSQGILTYNGSNKILFWKDVKLDADTSGLCSYRFICGQSISEVYSGPMVKVPEVVGIVEPTNGVIQAFPETNTLYSLTYTAQFKNWAERNELWVELLVRAPNSSWMAIGEKKQLEQCKENITWTVKPFTDDRFLGTAEFKFLINGKDSRVFSGPAISALYKDLDFMDKKTGMFDYSASINGSENLLVDLIYSTDNEKWTNLGQPVKYVRGTGWQKIVWSGKPAYYNFELDIRPEGSGAIYNV
jgi:hypothetical protein